MRVGVLANDVLNEGIPFVLNAAERDALMVVEQRFQVWWLSSNSQRCTAGGNQPCSAESRLTITD